MREKPILFLFSAPMVRAILSGSKSQTRRIVKPQPVKPDPSRPSYFPFQPEDWVWSANSWSSTISNSPAGPAGWAKHCPYGQPGERWQIVYAAGGAEEREAPAGYNPMLYNYERWSPSIHMPRWASRLTLEITGARVERLQDISEADAIAEGVTAVSSGGVTLFTTTGVNCFQTAKDAYAALWESINGPGSWDANPWVWVVSFKRNGGEW